MPQRKSHIPSCVRLINATQSSILLVSNLEKWSFPWRMERLLPLAFTELLFPEKYTNLARVPTWNAEINRCKLNSKYKIKENPKKERKGECNRMTKCRITKNDELKKNYPQYPMPNEIFGCQIGRPNSLRFRWFRDPSHRK